MKVFISGASGLIGGNCLEHFKNETDWEVTGTYFSYPVENTVYFNTLDLSDPLNFDLAKFSPDVIIHCGALTHVDHCEAHPDESYMKTVQSTINLLEWARRTKARFVYISSDYVFDGVNGPYVEEDKVNPLSVYGKHKLEGEHVVQKAGEIKSLIIRVTNVYGNEVRGKNFVARMIENAKKNTETAFPLPADQYATPVNAHDVARALRLLITDKKEGIYNIASTDFMNRMQLSDAVLKYFPGHQVKITPVTTAAMNQPANRPLLGGLISKKFMDQYPLFRFTNVDDFVRGKIR